jgi:hypothetical protein
MPKKKESYFYHKNLEQILHQLEQKFKNIDSRKLIDQLYADENTKTQADEFSWIYENKKNLLVKSDARLLDRVPNPMWYGDGEFFYSKILFLEDNFKLQIFQDLFEEFLTEISVLPGILRVNFFGLRNIGIVDHKDDAEVISGYHTFVALLNSLNDTEFKIGLTTVENIKYFFYDVNANHSAKNLSKNWWYIITIDVNDEYIKLDNIYADKN